MVSVTFPTPNQLFNNKQCKKTLMYAVALLLVLHIVTFMINPLLSLSGVIASLVSLYSVGVLCQNGFNKLVVVWFILNGLRVVFRGGLLSLVGLAVVKGSKSEGFCPACML